MSIIHFVTRLLWRVFRRRNVCVALTLRNCANCGETVPIGCDERCPICVDPQAGNNNERLLLNDVRCTANPRIAEHVKRILVREHVFRNCRDRVGGPSFFDNMLFNTPFSVSAPSGYSLEKQVYGTPLEVFGHQFPCRFPSTPPNYAYYFHAPLVPTCLMRFQEFRDDILDGSSRDLRDGHVVLRVKTHRCRTYPVLQAVVWLSSGFFSETFLDICGTDARGFMSDLCFLRRWQFIASRYAPAEEKRREALIDPVSATVAISESEANGILEAVGAAIQHYTTIPPRNRDFDQACSEFLKAAPPIDDIPWLR